MPSAPDAMRGGILVSLYFAQIGRLEKPSSTYELQNKLGGAKSSHLDFRHSKRLPPRPLRSLPAFQAWEQRWMPPYKDYSKK
ncbi:MAG: hypothetical protein IPN76_25455 [Saprospiraceae bacterium]|nr:hypothetical protein [Saprospiraceae bacterium]